MTPIYLLVGFGFFKPIPAIFVSSVSSETEDAEIASVGEETRVEVTGFFPYKSPKEDLGPSSEIFWVRVAHIFQSSKIRYIEGKGFGIRGSGYGP